jgi:rhodanese-related sulfurtransferase
MKKLSLILFSLVFIFAVSCNNEEATENNETAPATEAKTFSSADEMVEAAKAQIEELSIEKVKEMMDAEETFLLLDVREPDEFNKGYILGSVNIPRGVLEFRIKKESFWEDEMLYVPQNEDLIIVMCKSGKRGPLATVTLQSMGFTNVKHMDGGYKAFKEAYPDNIEKPAAEEGAEAMDGAAEEDDGGC